MKTLFCIFFCLWSILLCAQDQMFVHTATTTSISDNKTYIDHPDLNMNPDAKIVITHNWNPLGSTGVYNINVTGVLYDTIEEKWAIQNEDSTVPMLENTSYNIYVARADEVIEHIATTANQGTGPFYTVLDHPLLNETPSRKIVFSTYYNPNQVYNRKRYGMFYDEINLDRVIYTENFSNIPVNSAFFVVIEGDNVQSLRHEATPQNITNNRTVIDHPHLNNNPNAVIIFSHNWGIAGDASNVIIDKVMGVQYIDDQWAIFTEDQSPMPEDAKFDVIINAAPLYVNENQLLNLSVYPNPVIDFVSITSEENISKLNIYNLRGNLVLTSEENSTTVKLDLSELSGGIYFSEIFSEGKKKTLKLIKQ